MTTPPVIIINFKTYPQATGDGAAKIATALGLVDGARDKVMLAVQALDLYRLSGKGLLVLAQHVDATQPGQNTGKVTTAGVRAAGGHGSLLNHSEHPIDWKAAADAVAALRSQNLLSVICARDVEAATAAARIGPDFVAVEPPELIGGNVSVTTADPRIVRDSVDAVHLVNPNVRVLCGAGVKNGQDVAAALKLGADGVLVASGVVLARDPAAALTDLLEGLK
jgi:triosephosphate isomerase